MELEVSALVFLLVVVAFLAGLYGERYRSRWSRKRWRSKRATPSRAQVVSLKERRSPPVSLDAADQLRLVMEARFQKRRLLSKSEARVFYAAEKAVREQSLTWRVMAQVSLGEVLSSPDPAAYSAINSKRVDLLLVSHSGEPIAAIEYQGDGHYQGTAPARDAVKKEALRKAGVRYIEINTSHKPTDLAREISRIAAQVRHEPT